MLFIMNGLLYHPISIELHVLTLVLNLIDSSLSLFHSFAATFLSWLWKWDLLIEMRPKCGLFHQFGPHADQVRYCGLLWKQWILLYFVFRSKWISNQKIFRMLGGQGIVKIPKLNPEYLEMLQFKQTCSFKTSTRSPFCPPITMSITSTVSLYRNTFTRKPTVWSWVELIQLQWY